MGDGNPPAGWGSANIILSPVLLHAEAGAAGVEADED
jgi:hypothetical protein